MSPGSPSQAHILMGCLGCYSVWHGRQFGPPQLRAISSAQSRAVLRSIFVLKKVDHQSSIHVTDIQLLLRCLGVGRHLHLMSEIGVFEPLRQICFVSRRFQQDVPLHQRVDAVGGGESLFPQLLD